MTFVQKIRLAISRNRLLKPREKVIVALSGGSDSVALLRVLGELGYECHAVHVNFHLRGNESDRDERFVRELCKKLNVKVYFDSEDTKAYALKTKQSTEMAARELRYNFFAALSEKLSAPVAVAHHRDDDVETVLLNLVRGTGLRGLCGMNYKTCLRCSNGKKLTVIRPLLGVSRGDILDYLAHLGQDYVTDSTNLVDDVKRNKLRLDVIPLLAEMNPSFGDTFQKEINKFAEAYKLYRFAVGEWLSKISRNRFGDQILDLEKSDCPSSEAVVFEWLSPYGFNETQIRQIVEASRDGEETKRIDAPSYALVASHGRFALISKASLPENKAVELPEKGEVSFGNYILDVSCLDKFPPQRLLLNPEYAFIDARSAKFPLYVRPAREGDRFVPFGMRGGKLVSDYLNDCKAPAEERMRQLVVCDTEKTVWVAGRRVDNRVRISENSEKIVCIRIKSV